MGTVIELLKAGTVRANSMVVRDGARLALAPGDILKLPEVPMRTLRQGNDLVILAGGEEGAPPERYVVTGFFAPSSFGMVQIGPDEAGNVLTAQSDLGQAGTSPAEQAQGPQEPPADASGRPEDTPGDVRVLSNAAVARELAVPDTVPGLPVEAPGPAMDTRPALAERLADFRTAPLPRMVLGVEEAVPVRSNVNDNTPALFAAPVVTSMDGGGWMNRSNLAGQSYVIAGKGVDGLWVQVTLTGAKGTVVERIPVSDGKWSAALGSDAVAILGDGPVGVVAIHVSSRGQAVSNRNRMAVGVDTEAPPAPAYELSAALADGVITARDVATEALTFRGEASPGARLRLEVFDRNGAFAVGEAAADGNGRWLIDVRQLLTNLADGPVRFELLQVDAAGNATPAAPWTAQLRQQPPPAPRDLALDAASDTALRDGITADATPTMEGTTGAGWTVRVYRDSNLDSRPDETERVGTATAGADGRFSFSSPALGDGTHQFLFEAVDELGQVSRSASALRFRVDTLAMAPELDPVAVDDRISYVEALQPTLTFSGRGEAGAVVRLRLSAGATTLEHTASVDARGRWSIAAPSNTTALADRPRSLMYGFGEGFVGNVTVEVSQTDVAGNVSSSAERAVYMRTVPLGDITRLVLAPGQDTGRSATDGVTRLQTVGIVGEGPAGMLVRIYRDSDGNGSIDLAGDTLLQELAVGQNGVFSGNVTLPGQGRFDLLAVAYDPLSGTLGNLADLTQQLQVTVDTVIAPPTFDVVAGDNTVNLSEVAATGGVLLSGTGEPGARLQLVLRAGSVEDTSLEDVAVDAQGRWSVLLPLGTMQLLGNGPVSMRAVQTDLAGNASALADSPERAFEIRLGVLPAPRDLSLAPEDDTGRSSTDAVTQTSAALTVRGTSQPGYFIHLFDDANSNGLLDAGETLGVVTAAADGSFSSDINLAEGVHRIRAEARDEFGQTSGGSTALLIGVDRTAAPVTGLAITANNVVNAVEADAGLAVLTGTAEPRAMVRVRFFEGATVKLEREALADALTGAWSVPLSPAEVQTIGQGPRTATVVQEDLAGNVSAAASLQFVVDTVAGSQPAADSVSLATAWNEDPVRPWRDGGGAGVITWDEVSGISSGVPVSKTVTVAIPFVEGAAEGDALRVFWGTRSMQYTLSAADMGRGFALVPVAGDLIVANRELQAVVDVRAQYTDQAGNVGETFTVLTGIDASLTGRPPTLEFDPDNYGTRDTATNTYYSRFSSDNTLELEKTIAVSGRGVGNDTIVIFNDDELDGLQPGEELARITADEFGNYSASLSLAQGTYRLRTVGTAPVAGGAAPSPGEVTTLVVSVSQPAPPVLNTQGIAGDGRVSAAERDAGVVVRGTATAGNTVSIHLGNESTGVMGTVIRGIPVLADGSWTTTIPLVQWGQVGDGRIQLRVWQVDRAGNASAYYLAPGDALPTVVMDTFARPPVVDVVAADDRIGAAEAAANPLVSGGAEPGGTVVLVFNGTGGTRGPVSVEVNAEGRWSYVVDATEIAQLGNGPVQLTAFQIDAAGNRSADAVRPFVIDTLVAPPTIALVAGNDSINAAERALGVELTGTAEPGATVRVVLARGGTALPAKTAVASATGLWSVAVTTAEITTLGDGAATVTASQTDVAGNLSAAAQRAVTIAAGPLPGVVNVEPVGSDDVLSAPEQAAGVTLAGDAPVGTQVTIRLQPQGDKPFLDLVATVGNNGRWSAVLSRTQLETVLGPGDVSLAAWAVNGEQQSTATATRTFRIERQVPSPVLSRIAGDGFVNAAESADNVVVSGGGETGYVVTVTLTGTGGQVLSRTAPVGTDRRWAVTLTPGDIATLGQGAVALAAVQRESTAPDAPASLPTAATFVVDTLIPAAPNESDESAANAYNSAVSALAGGVTLAEAANGVTVAVALPRDAAPGDRVVLRWGDAEISRVLLPEDVPALGTRVLNVEVASGTIVAAGSGVIDISAVHVDAAGNAAPARIVTSNVQVTAPPRPPQFASIYGDGYINATEFAQIVSSGGRISGTAAGGGHVALTLTGPGGEVVSYPTLTVTGGEWSANLTSAQLLALGEGRINASAVFYSLSGAQSAPATVGFTFDRTPPSVPDAARLLQAAELNARNELAGGLIRPDGAQTEASYPVRVHVPLGANVTNGDVLSLFWGSQVVTTVVQPDDAERGYAVVTVGPAIISLAGDSQALVVEASVKDRAGNTCPRYPVWSGVVDAAPLPPEVASIATDGLVGLAEATSGWAIVGRGSPAGTITVTLRGTRTDAGGQPVSVQRTGITVDDGGNWQVTLTLAEAQALGDGAATLTAIQSDATGNVSTAVNRPLEIDLVAPAAPTLDPVTSDNRVSYAEGRADVPIGGVAESGARVAVRLTRGSTVIDKSAVVSEGRWSAVLTPADLEALGGGEIAVTVRQTDAAGNASPTTASSFTYSANAVAAPTIDSVTGITPGADRYFNRAELLAMQARYAADPADPDGLFTVRGTGNGVSSDHLIKLIAVNSDGASFLFSGITLDPNTGVWKKAFSAAELASLGQGEIRLQAITVSPQQDESLPARFVTGPGLETFFIDTVDPRLTGATIMATGFNGNARADDQLVVTVQASEPLTLQGLNLAIPPTVSLDFGGGQTRTAAFDEARTVAAGAGRLVFAYTVAPGDSAAGVTLAAASVTLNGVALRDAAGNTAAPAIAAVTAAPVLVDTLAPGAPVIGVVEQAEAATPGGVTVNRAEAAGGVRVRVSLAGTGVVTGDTLLLSWQAGGDTAVVSKQVTAGEVAAQELVVTVSPNTVGLYDGMATLTARLRDAAGNLSAASAARDVDVDTIAPVAPGITTWMADDKVNKDEVDSGLITALRGTLAEAGATLSAELTRLSGAPRPLDVINDGAGGWSVSLDQMVAAIAAIPDGRFSIRVTQTDTAGNLSPVAVRNYYVDRQRPGKPAILSIPAGDDGWVNIRDATVDGVRVDVSLAGTGAVEGDSLVVSGFASNYVHTVTATEAAQEAVSVPVSAAALQQAPGTLPQVGSGIRVRIEDQGGNVSDLSERFNVNVDTIITTPVVDVTRGAAAGITRSQSRAAVDFFGSGAEPGATVQVRLTGIQGNSFLLPTTARNDGTFKVTISPTDMVDLGDGPVSYEVRQIDAALNTSTAATGGFDLALTVRPPTLLLMTADNVVSATEALSPITYTGLGVPGSTVQLQFFVRDSNGVYEPTPRLSRLATSGASRIVVQADGTWSVTLSPADLQAISPAGQGNVLIQGVQVDGEGVASATVTQEFYIDRFPPTLAPAATRLRLFDGNADGANNDGLLVTFAEPVLVSELRKMTSWAAPAGRTFGTDARVEAVDARSINGQFYATQFRLFLDSDHNLAQGSVVTVKRGGIFDAGGNPASADQSFTLPSLAVPGLPTPPLDIMDDNRINGVESGNVRRLLFTTESTPAQLGASAGGLLRLTLDGAVVDQVIPKANFLTLDLTLAKEARLNQGVAVSTVVRVNFVDGTSSNITLFSTGDPITSGSPQRVYRFTSLQPVDLVNVTGISYVSSNLSNLGVPESTNLVRTGDATSTTLGVTLRFPNMVRLAAGATAWADVTVSFLDTNLPETVRLFSAPGTTATATAGVTELTFTRTLARPTSSNLMVFREGVGGVTLDPGITAVNTGAGAPVVTVGHATNVVVPASQLDGGDVLSGVLLDRNLVPVPSSERVISYTVENPSRIEYRQSLADALSAAGRTIVLFVDGRPVSPPVTMGITTLFLQLTAAWENREGNPGIWFGPQRVQAGEEVTATVRVTFKTPINGQSFRDVVLKAVGDQLLSKNTLEFTTAFPADIPATNVASIAYRQGSISSLHPQFSQALSTSISASQVVDLPTSAWAGEVDGLKQLTAQISTADGSLTSRFSAPKQIRLDRQVGSITGVRLESDANNNGILDAGDTVQIRFNENVQLTFGALPASFGQGALVTPVGNENGFSQLWNVRLGTGATLQPGQTFTLDRGEVFDQAANTNATGPATTGTLAPGIMTAANAPVIDNVGVGNVVSETGAPVAVKVLLSRARAGDVVQLSMDGAQVATATVTADGQADITFQVAGSAWGADGERVLTSSITRGGVTATSRGRSVYVQDDQSHWSQEAAFAGKVYWFDPDALAVVDGTVVPTWQASAGGISVANTGGANARTVRLTDPYSGRGYLVADAASVFLETAVGGTYRYQIPTLARFVNDSTMPTAGYTDFMLFKPVVEGSMNLLQHPTFRFTSNAATVTYMPSINGVLQPEYAVQPYTRLLRASPTWYDFSLVSSQVRTENGVPSVMPVSSMTNVMSLGAWQFVTQAVRNNTLSFYNQLRLNTTASLPGFVPNAQFHLPYMDYQNLSADDPLRRLRIGGGHGVLGDMISITAVTDWAYTQEIAAYLAAKHLSAGALVTRRVDGNYDLATSNVPGSIIDQILRLNDLVSDDTVTVAGADYVLTGGGNDTVRLRDLKFRHLDAGLGTDTLVIDNTWAGGRDIVLSDYISNARGLYGTAADNRRVNDAGYHRLMGFEVFDSVQFGATDDRRQVIAIAAADVKQLSETGTLEVRLGKEDVLRPSGFSVPGGTAGVFMFNGRWYDRRYTLTDAEGTYTMYSSGGDRVPEAVGFRSLPSLRQLHVSFDHSMVGTVSAGDFSIQTYSGPSAVVQSSVSIDLRQGVALTLSNAVTTVAKVTYNGTLVDDGGRGFEHVTWLIGTDGRDTLSGLVLTAAEQARGASFLGGAGGDVIVGTAGSDLIVGGQGADVLTGGLGSDTFLYRNEVTGSGGSGGLGGSSGDIITDFTFNAPNPVNNDRLDLSLLFERNFAATGNAAVDANTLSNGGFIEILKRINPQTNREDIQIWVDRDGGGAMGLLTTLADGSAQLPPNYPAVESSRDLLQRMLEEGRMVVATF